MVGNIEICERDCDLEDQPILYVNKGHGSWKRVRCDNCPLENKIGFKIKSLFSKLGM